MSAASPATGAERDVGRKRERAAGRKPATEQPLEVTLEHARWRHFGWTVAGLVVGAVLLWKLGVVGKAVGVVLCGLGLWAGRSFAATLLHPPGLIRVGEDQVTLPRGLCRSGPVTLPSHQVRHAFFLRRVVPWTRTGPVLVIEAGEHVFSFPRDWFASESDQRRVATALNRRLGRA